jgi:hypothetical protein
MRIIGRLAEIVGIILIVIAIEHVTSMPLGTKVTQFTFQNGTTQNKGVSLPPPVAEQSSGLPVLVIGIALGIGLIGWGNSVIRKIDRQRRHPPGEKGAPK